MGGKGAFPISLKLKWYSALCQEISSSVEVAAVALFDVGLHRIFQI